jgi:hypothetical protein
MKNNFRHLKLWAMLSVFCVCLNSSLPATSFAQAKEGDDAVTEDQRYVAPDVGAHPDIDTSGDFSKNLQLFGCKMEDGSQPWLTEADPTINAIPSGAASTAPFTGELESKCDKMKINYSGGTWHYLDLKNPSAAKAMFDGRIMRCTSHTNLLPYLVEVLERVRLARGLSCEQVSVHSTSTYRPGDPNYHGKCSAIDFRIGGAMSSKLVYDTAAMISKNQGWGGYGWYGEGAITHIDTGRSTTWNHTAIYARAGYAYRWPPN